jgi:hypothetical protein
VKRGPAVIADSVPNVGIFFFEKSQNPDVAFAGRQVEGRPTVLVDQVHVSAFVEKQFHNLENKKNSGIRLKTSFYQGRKN